MTAYHLSATPKTKKQVQEAQLQIAQNVLVWTNELCNALKNDYIHTSVESYKRKLHSASSEWDVQYYTQRIQEIKKNPDYNFVIESGRKYYKIIHQEFDRRSGNYRDSGVHAFVNKKTGEVYKPASWKSPHTKYVRYDLRIIKQREECYARADWAGGYLYLR